MAAQTSRSSFTADPAALYFTDNGAVYCGEHLGNTGRVTGRDISGQRIQKVSRSDIAEANSMHFTIKCETCGKQPQPIERAPVARVQRVRGSCNRCGEPWAGGGRCFDCERSYGPSHEDR